MTTETFCWWVVLVASILAALFNFLSILLLRKRR